MSDVETKCTRCEEPVVPVILGKMPPWGRFWGMVEVHTAKVRFRSVWPKPSRLGAHEGIQTFDTIAHLCDECWGAVLEWVNAPGQERAQIAAENRRKTQRKEEAAERRREESVKRYMEEVS